MTKYLPLLLFIEVCFGQEIEWFVSYNGSGEESMGTLLLNVKMVDFYRLEKPTFLVIRYRQNCMLSKLISMGLKCGIMKFI